MSYVSLNSLIEIGYISKLDLCNAVPGDMPSKFTKSEKHTYGAGYVMKMSICMIYG